MNKQETASTKTMTPVEAARAECERLYAMRDELKDRVAKLEAATGNMSSTLDDALDTRRELFVARETLGDIQKATRAAEVNELLAISQQHGGEAAEINRRATKLREVIAQDQQIVFQKFGQLYVDPMWTDAEVDSLAKTFASWLKTARDIALADHRSMSHLNEQMSFRQKAERLQREPLPA